MKDEGQVFHSGDLQVRQDREDTEGTGKFTSEAKAIVNGPMPRESKK